MTDQNDKREAAIRRVKAKRGFWVHVVVYLAVNVLLVVIWASSGGGLFLANFGGAGLGNWIGIPWLESVPPEADFGRGDPPRNGAGPLARPSGEPPVLRLLIGD